MPAHYASLIALGLTIMLVSVTFSLVQYAKVYAVVSRTAGRK